MTMLVVIALVVIALYVGAMIYHTKEIPNSISSTVFTLPTTGKWIFSAVMFAVAALLAPVLLELATPMTEFLAFLTIVGIGAVGATPLLANEKNTMHNVAAIVAGLASQMLVYFNHPHLLLLWFLYVGYTLAAKDGRKNLFWVEVACMLTIFAYCFIH